MRFRPQLFKKWIWSQSVGILFISLLARTAAAEPLNPFTLSRSDDTSEQAVPRNIFESKIGYVFGSDLENFGDQDALQTEIELAHRFHLTGNFYLRAGPRLQPIRFRFDGRAGARSPPERGRGDRG